MLEQSLLIDVLTVNFSYVSKHSWAKIVCFLHETLNRRTNDYIVGKASLMFLMANSSVFKLLIGKYVVNLFLH